MSDDNIEAADPSGGNSATDPAAGRAAPIRKPGKHPAGSGKRIPSRKPAARVNPSILRAVQVSFAVAAADRAVLGALAAITGTGSADAKAVAVAVAADAIGEPRLLADVLNLPHAGPADGMRVAISVASAGRDAQRELWTALTRLGFAAGKASPNPEELALAIVEAGQGIPEQEHPVLSAALDILAGGRES